jgi:hypothetical protein
VINPELQKHYEEICETLNSPGWRRLLIEFETHRSEFNKLSTCQTHDEMKFRQGQVDQLDYMLGLQNLYDTAWAAIVQEANDEANPPPEQE